MFDIISIGDATLDVFLEMNEENADVKCSLDNTNCQICFTYADKIPVERVIKIPGAGNGSNNAVGSSRLGLKTAIVGIVGDDDVGHEIIRRWKKEKVNTSHVILDKKRGTNYSTVINYHGERTILVFHEERTYRFPSTLPKARWIYYTSLGEGSEKMHSALLRYIKKHNAKLCFQPGTFQLKLGLEKLTPLIAASTVTIMNKEEAERLVGNETKSIEVLLKRLHTLGCEIAVITDGTKGAYTFDGQDVLSMDIFDVPIVERTGCGDAFATALVAALEQKLPLTEALRWGTANSASVLGHVGPQEGLLTTAGMKSMLKKFIKIQPKKLNA